MKNLISMLIAVQFLSHDLHYQAKGLPFYALHILADLCKDGINEMMDNLREMYYMGELKTIPPCDCETHAEAIQIVNGIRQNIGGDNKNLALIFRLREICSLIVAEVAELRKGDSLQSGTLSVLDTIGAKMQKNYALLDRCTLAE